MRFVDVSKGAALLGVAVSLIAAGCGSGSEQTESGAAAASGADGNALVKSAESVVAEAQAPVTEYELPTSAPQAVRDKEIVAVTCTNQGDGCPISAEGVAEATEDLGWEVRIVDGKGDPSVWNSAILNAVSSQADGIVLSAVAPALVKDAIAKANAAGIPIVSIFQPLDPNDGLWGHVTPDHREQGRQMANWVIADSGGEGKVVLIEDNEFVELEQRVDAFTEELGKCADCEVVATVPSTLASLSTRLPGAIASALQQNPDAKYVVAVTDNHAVFASQGIQQSGRAGDVKLTGYDGNTPSYDLIRNGEQANSIVEPYALQGWLTADLLIRAFAGEEPRDYVVPDRLLNQDNVPAEGLWETELPFREKLGALWTGGQG